MHYARMPRDIWGWHCTTIVTGMAVLAIVAAAGIRPGQTTLAQVASMAGLVAYPLVLTSAAFIYVHSRLIDGETSAWLATGLTSIGVVGLAVSGAVTARPGLLGTAGTWLVLIDLTLMIGLFALVSMARFGGPSIDPMGLGLAVGIGLGVVFGAALIRMDAPTLPPAMVLGLCMAALLLCAALAVYLVRQSTLPDWFSVRVALGVALLDVGDLAGVVHPLTGNAGVRLGATLLGAVLLFCATIALLRAEVEEATHALGAAGGRLALAEASHDSERARIHEIGSTFAGIASASRLISAGRHQLPEPRRTSLEQMVRAEMARLERLLAGHQNVAVSFEVDTVLRQLVLSHHARGHHVEWIPSGLRVAGVPDEVAEVVNVLLDNAAKHGVGVARVRAVEDAGMVRVSVSDEGIGVSPTLAHGAIFEWGARRDGSHGQGIGLSIARGLAERQGGSLELVDEPGRGTTFVLSLPTGVNHDGAVLGNLAS
jgi:signal transduction histidine kinase